VLYDVNGTALTDGLDNRESQDAPSRDRTKPVAALEASLDNRLVAVEAFAGLIPLLREP
jgi:hypothetical protein